MANILIKNVRDQIGFCGTWCGSCIAGNGAIIELTRRFRKTLKKFNIEKWASKEINFRALEKYLELIEAIPACIGCQKGGGPSNCLIKICASEQKFVNCGQCNELSDCNKFVLLEQKHPTIKESLIQNIKKDKKSLIKEWSEELKNKWPHSILFLPDE